MKTFLPVAAVIAVVFIAGGSANRQQDEQAIVEAFSREIAHVMMKSLVELGKKSTKNIMNGGLRPLKPSSLYGLTTLHYKPINTGSSIDVSKFLTSGTNLVSNTNPIPTVPILGTHKRVFSDVPPRSEISRGDILFFFNRVMGWYPNVKETFSLVTSSYSADGKPLFTKSIGAKPGEHNEDRVLAIMKMWPEQFWISNSPCPDCAYEIGIQVDKQKKGSTYTIYFLNFYEIPIEDKNFAHDLAINCGVFLKCKGVNLKIFDLEKFAQEAKLTLAEKSFIGEILESSAWKELRKKNEKSLEEINDQFKITDCSNYKKMHELCAKRPVKYALLN